MIMTKAPIRKAVVLAAGLGMRLRPLTDVRAKPAMPVAGEPMIRRIIGWLVSQGADDLVLNLHHRPETITAVVGDGRDLGARVRYSWEYPRILGSAGGPRLAWPIIGDGEPGTFLIINGDTLTDVDLARLADAHAAFGALVTLALVPNRAFTRYGGVRLDEEGRVVGFARRGPSSAGTYHFIGVQIADARKRQRREVNRPGVQRQHDRRAVGRDDPEVPTVRRVAGQRHHARVESGQSAVAQIAGDPFAKLSAVGGAGLVHGHPGADQGVRPGPTPSSEPTSSGVSTRSSSFPRMRIARR